MTKLETINDLIANLSPSERARFESDRARELDFLNRSLRHRMDEWSAHNREEDVDFDEIDERDQARFCKPAWAGEDWFPPRW